MLQTVVEAASWLLRITEDYRFSIIALREVKNVKYGSFMEPGRTMKVHVEVQELGASEAVFKGRGECDGASTVSGRIVLARYNLSDRSPEMKDLDRDIIDGLQRRHRILTIGGMKG
jgi:3-hydroxyacyl-[acyl-carrier-protein] dehydratase